MHSLILRKAPKITGPPEIVAVKLCPAVVTEKPFTDTKPSITKEYVAEYEIGLSNDI
jgi:hypothetical protein